MVAAGLVSLVLAGVTVAARQLEASGPTKPRATLSAHQPARLAAIPAIEAGMLPWQLPQPVSRELLFLRSAGTLAVVGGLDRAGHSTSGIFSLDTTTGSLTPLGSLSVGTHDAAGVRIGGRDLVLGGGSPTTNARVQAFTATAAGTRTLVGSRIGNLPRPRSDASAVSIGRTAYVVGGYDGRGPDSSVLATGDGRRFTVVAHLPVPVRYAAVAALGGTIYLFGGEAVSGPRAGTPVATIQMVDPAAKSARVVGHLPRPLAGAAAAVLGGNLYLAGGVVSIGKRNVATTRAILAYAPTSRRVLRAGSLAEPVAYAALQTVGVRAWLVGGERGGVPVSSVQMFTPNRRFGIAGAAGAGSPFFGQKLLIADRGNNRLLLINDRNRIIWSYPSNYAAAPAGGFYFPDDAFFVRHGTEIISNQEQNDTIVIIAFPSGRILWHYGHPRRAGSAPGYLHEPDDAYVLKSGQVVVADAYACRVLIIARDKKARQIGTSNVCKHRPPSEIATPNGATPLRDGNLLVSEINGSWVSEYTLSGRLAWSVHLPISYPSDPQQLGPNRYLISDYTSPGGILEFNRAGRILYRYQPNAGPGALNHNSLTELLPSGVFMTNDDYRHRMVAIDPATRALVWQYGTTDTPGTAPGMLNTPDGFDLLLPNGATPTHPWTG